MKIFCLHYVRTAALPEKFCGAFSKATARARRRIGIFLFGAFSFCASKGKKKKRCGGKSNFKKAYTNKHCNKFLFANSYLKPVVLFSFEKGGAKEKRTKKERRRRGDFACCDKRQGLRALDLRRLAGGGLSWVQCEHTASKNFSFIGTVRTHR